jgi:hypothetical protein
VCFPEGVVVDDIAPGCVGALLEGVVVAVVGGVVFVFDEVEVTTYDEVGVIGDAFKQLELLGAAAVMVVAGGEVYVEQPEGEGGVAITCSSFKAQALSLTLEVGTEWFCVGVVVVACVGREHDESAALVVCGVVVEEAPKGEGRF